MVNHQKVVRALVTVIVAGLCQSALGQDGKPSLHTQQLAEADVIRLAIRSGSQLRAAVAEVAVAEAHVIGAGLPENPWLEWERDAYVGAGPDSGAEDAFVLAVPLDLSGRRSASRARARSAVDVAKAGARVTQSAAVLRALRVYYGALAAQQGAAISSRAVERLDEAARILARRHTEGAVSGYDRLRLEIEVELVRSQSLLAQAEQRRALAVLGTLLDLQPDQMQLTGTLTPNLAVTPAQVSAQEQRPSERSLAAAMSALQDASDAAGSAWIPRLELKGGMRTGSASDPSLGYVAGISVELPFLSHGQGLSQATRAERLAVQEQIAAARQTARVDSTDASVRLAAGRQELARFDAAVAKRLESLDRGAMASYREGVRGLTELLDAQRTRTMVERRLLELRLMAKHAEVALRAARGELQ